MRRLLHLVLLLQLTACSSLSLPGLGFYATELDNTKLHEEVFAESYRRLAVYYLEPVNLGQLVPAGLAGLKQIDPTYVPAISNQAEADDWNRWADITYNSIRNAQAQSSKLAAATPDDIYNAYFPALMAKLDGFSRYVPPLDTKSEKEMQTGYGGIGVTFERKGSNFVIMDTFIDSPAQHAGLKAGQIIHAIDGMPVNELSITEFAEKVRGPVNAPLTLRVARPGEAQQDVRIIRAQVIPTTVALTMERSVAVIRISRFMPGTVREFRQAARQAVWNRSTAVILDMQHNPGGILESAVDIAGLLLPRGSVGSTSGRHPDAQHDYNTSGADILNGLPIYVLMDGRSASAAEVLAAALQDRGRATLIGSTSYGKGSVQSVGPLPHGGEIAVTWARLLSPSGHSWTHEGLHPDICVVAGQPCPKLDDITVQALAKALELARR